MFKTDWNTLGDVEESKILALSHRRAHLDTTTTH
jgi:hypothetical protein